VHPASATPAQLHPACAPPSQVHPALQDYIPGGARFPGDCTTTAGLLAAMQSVRVVAVTCLGVRHPLLAGRTFDVCVLDEASQVRMARASV